jgi:hypothetical protein
LRQRSRAALPKCNEKYGLSAAPLVVDKSVIAAGAGMVFIASGYGAFGQPPGNVLLAVRPKKKSLTKK